MDEPIAAGSEESESMRAARYEERDMRNMT
jgi:hypothetical protein